MRRVRPEPVRESDREKMRERDRLRPAQPPWARGVAGEAGGASEPGSGRFGFGGKVREEEEEEAEGEGRGGWGWGWGA